MKEKMCLRKNIMPYARLPYTFTFVFTACLLVQHRSFHPAWPVTATLEWLVLKGSYQICEIHWWSMLDHLCKYGGETHAKQSNKQPSNTLKETFMLRSLLSRRVRQQQSMGHPWQSALPMKTIIAVIKYEQEGTEVLNKHKARMGGHKITSHFIAKDCFSRFWRQLACLIIAFKLVF